MSETKTELAEAYCPRCRDNVSPIAGLCPWCDTIISEEARPRRWCETEDRLVVAGDNELCWRCGERTKPLPWIRCGCGCGAEIVAFDAQGRRREYLHGHAPRSRERRRLLEAEPFVLYLESQLERLDLIGALARQQGLKREELVALLRRRQGEVEWETVRRSLWIAARAGMGKGMPSRADAIRIEDLYPDAVRKKKCPRCGQGKAPHAELCKTCRRAQDRRDGKRPPAAQTKLRNELILEAAAHYADGESLIGAARRIFERAPHKSLESLSRVLSREFKKRGIEVRARSSQ